MGYASLCVRHERTNGHGTAQETRVCMEIVFPCFSSSTTVCTESRPRRISQPAAYRREAEESVGIYPLAECHSTHVSAKIRALNRAECVIETLRHALNVLAMVAPVWLRSQVQPEWLDRSGHRAEEYRLPTSAEKRQALLHQVGQDGWGLLTAIQAEPTSHWMLAVPAIATLQRVWKQDYLPPDQGGTWIPDEDRLPAAKLFYSPYDLDASAGTKRSTHWIG